MSHNSFEEIIERIKDLVSIKHGNKKVFDKDVAYYLGLCHKKLSYCKRNNKIPYEELSRFCYCERVPVEQVLFM